MKIVPLLCALALASTPRAVRGDLPGLFQKAREQFFPEKVERPAPMPEPALAVRIDKAGKPLPGARVIWRTPTGEVAAIDGATTTDRRGGLHAAFDPAAVRGLASLTLEAELPDGERVSFPNVALGTSETQRKLAAGNVSITVTAPSR